MAASCAAPLVRMGGLKTLLLLPGAPPLPTPGLPLPPDAGLPALPVLALPPAFELPTPPLAFELTLDEPQLRHKPNAAPATRHREKMIMA